LRFTVTRTRTADALPMMSADEREPPAPIARDEAGKRRPRWFWMYFLLAALDVITVLVSLGLNYRLMQIYTDSVAVNQEWAARLSTQADLSALAGEVNAPGNDVFDTRDVALESARMQKSLEKFNHAFQTTRQEIAALQSPETPLLLDHFSEIEKAMAEMVKEAELIFSFFEQKRSDKAGERWIANTPR
jgi:two-component system, NtrC family, sensor kinase